MTMLRVTSFSLMALAVSSLAVAAEWTKDPLPTVKKNVDEKKAVLVDVREKSEWDQGHVKGAVFLPLSELQNKFDEDLIRKALPKDKIVYTHCRSGVRSRTAGPLLEKLGYDVRCLKPGYADLIEAGFESAKD